MVATIGGVPVIFAVLYGLAFLGGVLTIPLIAWGGGSAIPGALGRSIANALWTLVMVGTGRGLYDQQETGEYVWRRATPDEREEMEPRSYWSRWATGTVGITFEKTQRAFGTLVENTELDHKEPESRMPGKKAEAECDRGGKKWYVDLSADPSNLFVPVGEKLSELRGAAGTKVGEEAIAESLKEHGGDTSSSSGKLHFVAMFTFLFCGVGMGYVVFF